MQILFYCVSQYTLWLWRCSSWYFIFISHSTHCWQLRWEAEDASGNIGWVPSNFFEDDGKEGNIDEECWRKSTNHEPNVWNSKGGGVKANNKDWNYTCYSHATSVQKKTEILDKSPKTIDILLVFLNRSEALQHTVVLPMQLWTLPPAFHFFRRRNPRSCCWSGCWARGRLDDRFALYPPVTIFTFHVMFPSRLYISYHIILCHNNFAWAHYPS